MALSKYFVLESRIEKEGGGYANYHSHLQDYDKCVLTIYDDFNRKVYCQHGSAQVLSEILADWRKGVLYDV